MRADGRGRCRCASDTHLYLDASLPAVVLEYGGDGFGGVVVGYVGLYFQRMPYDIFGNAEGGLVVGLVAYVWAYLGFGHEGRVAGGNLPILGEDVACLHIESHAGIYVLFHDIVLVYEGIVAEPAHEVGVEGEAVIFEDEVYEIRLQRTAVAVDKLGAVFALYTYGTVVVAVCAGYHQFGSLFALEVAFGNVAQGLETSQREEFHASRVGKAAIGRYAEVASVARCDGCFHGILECFADVIVIFAEETEVAVEIKF